MDTMRTKHGKRARIVGAGLAATAVLMTTGGVHAVGSPAVPAPLVLADTNRDGIVDQRDAAGRGTWTKESGAFFLANLDDDLARCASKAADGSRLSDVQLAACNDGADRTINGDEDVKDLARVKVAPAAAGKADKVRVEVRGVGASKVNVWVRHGEGSRAGDWKLLPSTGLLPTSLLSRGVELGIEGKDIIRDASWDGTVTIKVVHQLGGRQVASDSVEMRVAPVLFTNDTMPMTTLLAADNATSVYDETPAAPANDRILGTQVPFRADLETGLERIGGGVDLKLLPSLDGQRNGTPGTDVWTQDIMEPGFMSIPAADGTQSMQLWVRAPVRDGRDNSGVNPFRGSGRVIFTQLRGPDVAAVQHFDPGYEPTVHAGTSYDSFGSAGNYGTVPPHEHAGTTYPLGRKIFGSEGTYTGDPAFNAMLEAQGYQDPIVVDTSWLGVGHVDEFVSFIPADTERGWAMVVADPQLAVNLLQDLADEGRGDEPLLQPYGFDVTGVTMPTTSIAETLANPAIQSGVRNAVAGVNKALKVIKAETGLTESDIIRVPVLYTGNRVGVAIPNAANLIGTGHEVVFVAKQHAPAVDGQDLFQSVIEERFAEVGTQVQWVEDYRYAHPGGEIHCVTNVVRDHTVAANWWTEGAQAGPVEAAPASFVQVGRTTVKGKFKVGRKIKVTAGKLAPTPTRTTYQWFAGKKAIKGATKPKLKLTKAMVGKKISVRITATRTGYQPLTTLTQVGKKALRR